MLQEQNAHKLGYTPWGAEVKRKLLERELARTPPCTQIDVVAHLVSKGFNINKQTFTFMLKGTGVTKRTAEVNEINKLLGIAIAEG